VILPLLGVIESRARASLKPSEADFDRAYAPKTAATKTLVKPAE